MPTKTDRRESGDTDREVKIAVTKKKKRKKKTKSRRKEMGRSWETELVNEKVVKNSESAARKALSNLLLYDKKLKKHAPKVCCLCDQLIAFDNESSVEATILMDKENRVWHRLAKCSRKGEECKLPKSLQEYYCSVNVEYRELRKLWLSRGSYVKKKGSKGMKDLELGCCCNCKKEIKKMKEDPDHMPLYIIANGLQIGGPPKVLTDLTECELALISIARVSKHIFSYRGGSHKSIRGWHTLYENDMESVNGVINFFADRESRAAKEFENREDRDDDFKRKVPQVVVVLSGPFTKAQVAKIEKAFTINWTNCKKALNWLRKNNRFYQNFEFEPEAMIKPIIINRSTIVESENSNIENVSETHCVFPDATSPDEVKNGFESAETFRNEALADTLDGKEDSKITLISRPKKEVLKDYQGDNLLKAFPLQFPCGIGNDDAREEERCRVSSSPTYFKYLTRLRNAHMHRADFCVVLHNMQIRKNMVNRVFVRTDEDERIGVGKLTIYDMEEAAERHLNGASGSGHADKFIKATKAVTDVIPHSSGAAKRARQHAFAMVTRFGPPHIMLTVTPEDACNYRIRVHAGRDNYEKIPSHKEDENVISDFMLECASDRLNYPGLCAFEFENVIGITKRDILGWDTKSKKAIKGKGVLGTVEAMCHADEEQGRKTLHAHILLWLLGMSEMLLGLHSDDLNNRKYWQSQFEDYVGRIVRNKLCGEEIPECLDCKESLTACEAQDLRALRYVNGQTQFAKEDYEQDDEEDEDEKNKFMASESCYRDIMYCEKCNKAYSSEKLGLMKLEKLDVLSNADGKLFKDANCITHYGDIRKKRMECLIMKLGMPAECKTIASDMKKHNITMDQVDATVGVLRNLHSSSHCKTCFKKGNECRANHPKLPSEETKVDMLHDDLKPWYSWRGKKSRRPLWNVLNQRGVADVFMNCSNETIDRVLGCNNNVICGITGASGMHCTCYTFKSTFEEDNKMYGRSCRCMVSKLTHNKAMSEEERKEFESRTIDEQEYERQGLKTMVGAAFYASQSHICSAPMAAHMIQSGGRFWFSTDFQCVNIEAFHLPEVYEFCLDKIDDEVVLKSQVQNYIFRPDRLSDVNLHVFLMEYRVTRKNAKSLRLQKGSMASNKMAITKNAHRKTPVVTFLDFPDTRQFEGNDILNVKYEEPAPLWMEKMNEYAKVVLTLFVPFRKVTELVHRDGSCLSKFQEVYGNEFDTDYCKILMNVQDCYNGLNAGRPDDPLNLKTSPMEFVDHDVPERTEEDEEVDEEEVNFGDLFAEMLKDPTFMVQDKEKSDLMFRTQSKEFTMKSRVTRDLGTYKSGYQLIKTPNPRVKQSVVSLASQRRRDNPLLIAQKDTRPFESLTHNKLHELCIRWTERVTSGNTNKDLERIGATGCLSNMQAWGKSLSKGDKDQMTAFVCIVVAFVLEVHKQADANLEAGRSFKRSKLNSKKSRDELLSIFKTEQLPVRMFLTGSGGSGKSRVIKGVVDYCKHLFKNLGLPFTRKTIVVTAVTGAAAVEVNGETTHSGLHLNKRDKTVHELVEEYNGSLMVIVDEISFMKKSDYLKTLRNISILKKSYNYVPIPVIFAGDFTQLSPVCGNPLYAYQDLEQFWYFLSSFIELRTPHRFKDDVMWGKRLTRYRDQGPTTTDIDVINQRVVGSRGGPTEADIPADACYAVKDNIDRVAINDGIFMSIIERTHSKNKSVNPPLNAICVRGSNIKAGNKSAGSRSIEWVDIGQHAKDLLVATCGEAHVKQGDSKNISPLLKFYYDQPVMNIENDDVENKKANGTIGKFRRITLKPGAQTSDLEKICIDGYYVYCADACQVEAVHLELEESKEEIDVYSKTYQTVCRLPLSIDGSLNRYTKRFRKRMKFDQFPLNIANARTVHKLQGKTLLNLVISSWDYTGNWIYVVLSRVRTLSGVFLRSALKWHKCRGMSTECREFLNAFRTTKKVEIDV